MKITVLCVGKIKESYLREAIAEYSKRLSRYAELQIVEVADEKTPDDASPATEVKILQTEGERLLRALRKDAYTVVLAIDGKGLSSVQLSEKIDALTVSGVSHIQFVIGGSLGLAPEVIAAADFRLSFSAMTFPHQLMRVILLEQIYRAFRIRTGEPYHK
ncbi:MAG: 23S rRNA (pseudouridine(1915)-N(3))-methyltransferase RlmH [Lachnospiraceae bacterium]|nr:23S rRNA (pseudouridine(1915)-N(3))-methyltransferase RlmH [Lachnospiraceae bacterium]MCR5086182.1 23S rRNA (pseudouridine(1915)-N(3))-methyltransferase RlmH [Lachnospiraceae bacterium]